MIVSSNKVQRGVVFETALPAFDTPGPMELQVYFSENALEAKQQQPSLTIAFQVQ
jgi:hypothetical protein